MSFTLNTTTGAITQSGTDTNLSGLSGIAGVSVTSLGGGTDYGGIISYPKVYQLTKQLVVEGDLTFDANDESLMLISGQKAILLKNGASLNISALYQGSPTRALAINSNIYQYGAFWQAWNATITAEAGATIDFEGITIGAQQNLFLEQASGTIKNCVIIGDTNDEPLFKIGQNLSIDGLEVIGTHGLILGASNDMVVKNVNVKSSLKVTQHDATGWTWTQAVPSFPTFEDYTSNGGSQIDFRMWWNGGYKVLNSATGSDLNNELGAVGNGLGNGFAWVTKKLSMSYADSSGTPIQGIKSVINDYNNGSRRSLQSVGDGYTLLVNKVPNFANDLTYSSTSDANGDSAELEVTTAVWTGSKTDSDINGQWDYRSKNNGNDDIFDIAHAHYDYLISASTVALKGLGTLNVTVILFDDSSITDSRVNTDALTEIDTPQKFYNRAKAYLVDNFAGETSTIVSREGNSIDAGSYNVVVDGDVTDAASAFAISGNTLTIKATRFVGNISTTGTTTLSNGAEVIGTFGSTTVLPWEVKNVEGTSRIQLVNVTQNNTEVVNTKLTSSDPFVDASGTYTSSEIAVGDVIRLRVTCVVGATALLPVLQTGVATTTGITFQVDQEADTVYNANGINGSTITTLRADYTNPMGVDVSDEDGTASVKEIYAFFTYSTTTADGVENWFGGMRAIDNANYEVITANADIKIQNIGSNAVVVSDGRMYRDDGASVLYAEDNDKPITMDSGALVTNVQPMVEAGLNANAKISSINNNSKLIPGLL